MRPEKRERIFINKSIISKFSKQFTRGETFIGALVEVGP